MLAATLGSSLEARGQARIRVPEGCGSERAFSRELERLLGADAAQAEPTSVSITERDASGRYLLRMQLRDELRELRHTDCPLLFRSAVVVAAAAFRRQHPPRAADGQAPPSTAPPAGSHGVPLLPEQPPPPRRPMSWHASLGLGGGVGAGVAPDLAPFIEFDAAAGLHQWGVSLALRYFSETEATDDSGRGVAVQTTGSRLALTFEPAPFARVGAGVAVYRLGGRGLGSTERFSDAVWAVAPVMELTGILFRIGYLRLELAVDAQLVLDRPRFVIDGFGPVYRMPGLGASGVFRAVWHFR
jgi:hypothetical protein